MIPSVPPITRTDTPPASGPATVVYIAATNEIGGADASLYELVRCLDRERYTPHVVLPHAGPYTERYRALGVRVHHVPLKKLKHTLNPLWHAAWLGRAPARIWRIAKLLEALQPRIVHINVSVELLAGLAARRHCSRTGAQLVWHVRELDLKPRAVESAVFGLVRWWADRILTISSPLQDKLVRGAPLPPPIEVIHNGVDLQRFAPRRPRPGRAPVLGWVGRLVPWKGVDHVLTVFDGVCRAIPDARLLLQTAPVAAHGEHARALRRRADRLACAARIEWRDSSPTPETSYAEMDLFVHLPVLQEPFGRTLVEAQAVGVPVLTWPHGGIVDAVRDGDTGRLVPVGDLDAAVNTATEMLRDRDALAAMGARAARFAQDRFGAQRYASRVADSYDAVVATAP